MTTTTQMPAPTRVAAGINGNQHGTADITHYGDLVWQSTYRPLPAGVRYDGDGEWTLPAGARIRADGGDDWTITMPDGLELSVWSEE